MLTHAKALVIDSWQISDICPPNGTLTLANHQVVRMEKLLVDQKKISVASL